MIEISNVHKSFGDLEVVKGVSLTVQTDTRLRVRGSDNDEHLVGIGDDDALDGIRIVGTAPEQRLARNDAHDARQAALGSRRVADNVDAVAGDHRVLAQLAGARRRHLALIRRVLIEHHGVATAVNGQDAPGQGILVLWSGLASSPACSGPVFRPRWC